MSDLWKKWSQIASDDIAEREAREKDDGPSGLCFLGLVAFLAVLIVLIVMIWR